MTSPDHRPPSGRPRLEGDQTGMPLPGDLADLARTLGELFRSGGARRLGFDGIPDAQAAYRVQEQAIAATGLTRVGYKLGATSTEAQAFLSCEGPIYGPVFAERTFASGAEVMLPEVPIGLECEFGFLIGRDIRGGPDAITPDAVADRVAECFPAIEVAARRSPAGSSIDAVSTIADLCMAHAMVRGAPIAEWRRRDLVAMPVTLAREGTVLAEGTGARVLGDPLAPLVWLARTLARSGRMLRAGEIVVTGSCTGVTPVAPGHCFSARFDQLPPVELRFTELFAPDG